MKEEGKCNGIFQTFNMEKFFDKEGLLDFMYTLNKEAKICDKDYRLWYKLNEDANISVRTSVGESGTCRVKNSLGQGMLGAALASSLNIGCALKIPSEVQLPQCCASCPSTPSSCRTTSAR